MLALLSDVWRPEDVFETAGMRSGFRVSCIGAPRIREDEGPGYLIGIEVGSLLPGLPLFRKVWL